MIALALKYLFSKKRQTFLMLMGIFFGTAAYIAISGMMLGFREYLVDQLVNNSAHVHIQAREEFLTDHSLDKPYFGDIFSYVFWDVPPSGRKDSAMVENPQNWYRRLDVDPRVVAYSPQLTANVILANGKSTASTLMTGCNPMQQVQVTNIGEYVKQGSFADLAAGGNRIIVGSELQKMLGLRMSQNVFVSMGNGESTPFKVVGIFKTGNKMSDVAVFGAIGDVQRLNRTPNQINEIGVKLKDHTQAAAIASSWSTISSEKIESWDQKDANLFEVFRIQDVVRFISIGAILIVAAFGIYNVLNMTVVQKRKDIAILRSMGYSSGEVIYLFFSQGIILGVSGVVSGLAFGYAFTQYMATIPFSGGTMGSDQGHLMVAQHLSIYVQAALLSLFSASIASILPARAAGKLMPIEIIRAGAE